MGRCSITGYDVLHNGLYMICVSPDESVEHKSCYVTPGRWEDSDCPFKYKFKRMFTITDYGNTAFVDIDKWLQKISTIPGQ